MRRTKQAANFSAQLSAPTVPACATCWAGITGIRLALNARTDLGPPATPYERQFNRMAYGTPVVPQFELIPMAFRPRKWTLRGRGGRRRKVEAELAEMGFKNTGGRPHPVEPWIVRAVARSLHLMFAHWSEHPAHAPVAWSEALQVDHATAGLLRLSLRTVRRHVGPGGPAELAQQLAEGMAARG